MSLINTNLASTVKKYANDAWSNFDSLAVFPGKSHWNVENIPDLSGRVALVTGGNSGIGKETCIELAKRGAKVYMGARSEARAKVALEEIKKRAGDDVKVVWLKLDLEDFDSIKAAVKEFTTEEKQLHLFYQNAGVMATPYSENKDGIENQWCSNVVGHFALFKLLLPTLLETAKKSPKGQVRVINVSSYGHNFAPSGGINLKNPNLKDHNTWNRYGQSKLGNILMSKEIARRYGDQGIYSLSLHPGNISTELVRGPVQSYGWFGAIMEKCMGAFKWMFLTPPQGAITQLYAGTSDEIVEKSLNGAYLVPYCRPMTPSSYATDLDLAVRTWEHLEKQVQGKV